MVTRDLSPDIRLKYWRIRLQYFPGIAFFGVLVSVISRSSSFPNLRLFLAETMMQLVGMTAVYTFWLYISRALTYFDKERISRSQIMAIGAAGGLLMALSQSLLSWIFQVPLQTDFALRAFGNVVVAAFWLPLQSVVVGNFRRFNRMKQDIRDEILRQESVRLARVRALEQYRQKIEGNIQEKLKLTTTEAHDLFESLKSKGSVRIPDHLRTISNEYFRLTAHKMDTMIKIRKFRFINLRANFRNLYNAVCGSITTRPLNATWFSIVIVITVITPLTAKSEYLLIPEIALATGFSTYLVQRILIKSFQYIDSKRRLATLLATIGNVLIPVFIARYIPNNDPRISNHIAYFFVVIMVTGLGHMAQAGVLREEELRTAFERDLSELKIAEKEQNAEFSKVTRDWAKYIHGTYTTKLEAAAIAIEAAIAADDADATEQAINEIERTLKMDTTRSISNPQILIEEVQDRCGNWQGLIEINIQNAISGDVAVLVSIKDVGDCVEEAILNAVRHGDCSTIEIQISENESDICLLITNDGIGFREKSNGFGSSIYEEATGGNWKLWRDERNQSTFLELNFAKA